MAPPPTEPGRPRLLRSLNERRALTALMTDGALTRVQLAEATGLSAPTTSQLVARLEAAGLVRPAGRAAQGRGPNAVVYQLCTDTMRGVALDLQSDRIIAQVVDATNQTYPLAEVKRFGGQRQAETDLAAGIAAACAAAGQARDAIVAICAGLPGAVSPADDRLRFVDALPGWPRRRVRQQLEQRLAVTVLIDNDVNLAAVAEAAARPDDGDFALLWVGHGVGVAWLADGRVRSGASGGAGEIGTLLVPGQAGGVTAEQYLGSRGLIALVRGHRPATRTFAAALAAVAQPRLWPGVQADLAARLAAVIPPILALIDPVTLVLAGPTGVAIGLAGANAIQAELRRATHWRTPLTVAAVTDQPVLRGAALTLSRHLADRTLAQVA